ncbi:hypothetical protein BDV96DRAFT_590898 [Lophiotrema nucula]|uniref:Uncharacterized protein n=1 Tax=Lophiotrema nucula TaxID=690887 RepID=A0A6A5YI27_9PLEO|nr:hypothetical protein BDV96DRAFT_590898 [Lophiotrema nucula]
MPDLAAKSNTASSLYETPGIAGPSATQQSSTPPSLHHGIGDPTAAILPPTVTPATTTRQSVSLGVLSTFWDSNTPTPNSRDSQQDQPVPSIVTHAPSPDAQGPPVDLAASTSSVPSTTTTLTNTLPPTQSAALRALNAPAFQSRASSSNKGKTAKSTSSRTTLSSQPVVVRTYSGSRHTSRPSSGLNSPRLFPNMSGHTTPQTPSALSAGLASRNERIPTVDDFSFSAILRAVDPEIRDAIDAIAEICARSRLSLANEYDAHLPPQGEITGAGPGWAAGMGSLVGRGRISRVGQGWTAAENTLTAVPEASSSSERLAGESRGSLSGSKKRSQSAYGSLKSVISGGSGKRRAIDTEASKSPTEAEQSQPGPQWAIQPPSSSSDHPAITLVTTPQTSKQLSFDLSSTIADILEAAEASREGPANNEAAQSSSHRRNTSATSIAYSSRTRSSTLSSLASWMPWTRASEQDATPQELTRAEARLREMLILSQTSRLGKGKAPVSVA